MLLDVSTFRDRVHFDLDGLVSDLQAETRRSTPSEATAWRNSLPTFAEVLQHEDLQAFHLQVGGLSSVAVEYRLPASASWADVVLLGRDEQRPSVVIVELKDWNTKGDAPGPREGLILHANREALHPSDQVRGYVECCRRFHSAVQSDEAGVSGCVFFTFASSADAYRAEPHQDLVAEFPVFTRCKDDITCELPAHLSTKLVHPDGEFAKRFASGAYQQDRGFVRQISAAIREVETTPFVLLDEQRTGFQKCMKHVERVLKPAKVSAKPRPPRKSVVIVEGPPAPASR